MRVVQWLTRIAALVVVAGGGLGGCSSDATSSTTDGGGGGSGGSGTDAGAASDTGSGGSSTMDSGRADTGPVVCTGGDLATLDAGSTTLPDGGQTGACYACVQANCAQAITTCKGNCTCNSTLIAYFTCLGQGSDPFTCFGGGGGPSLPPVDVQDAEGPLFSCMGLDFGGQGPTGACVAQCGLQFPDGGPPGP